MFTHRLLEGAVEPAVVDHVLDGDWWILQVLERVHQDEVQHNIIEVQVLHLVRRRIKRDNLEVCPLLTVRHHIVDKFNNLVLLRLVWPAPPRCFPSAPCAPGRKSSPRTLPRICLGSENQTLTVRRGRHSLKMLHLIIH